MYLAYGMFKVVPTGFIPPQDQGYVIVNVQMPDASSIERTNAVVSQLAGLARKTKGISDAFAVSGFSILTRSNSSAAGLLFLHFTPFSERAGKPDMTATAIAGAAQAAVQHRRGRAGGGAAAARGQRDRQCRRLYNAG